MRKALFLGLCLLASSVLAATQSDPFPEVATSYLVELNGNAIWARHPDLRLPPASLTKLMTALLVLEQTRPDDIVTVSPSANDACQALADHVDGNESRFVARMNRRAQALGLHDTHFTNACGHDKPGHYSSPKDLSILAHALLKHPSLLDITAQKQLQIVTLDGQDRWWDAVDVLDLAFDHARDTP